MRCGSDSWNGEGKAARRAALAVFAKPFRAPLTSAGLKGIRQATVNTNGTTKKVDEVCRSCNLGAAVLLINVAESLGTCSLVLQDTAAAG